MITKNQFYKRLINDKKNINDKINLILLKQIGSAYFARNFDINNIRNIINNHKKTF